MSAPLKGYDEPEILRYESPSIRPIGADVRHWLLSQLVTTGLVVIWSLGTNRFWTFRVAGASRAV